MPLIPNTNEQMYEQAEAVDVTKYRQLIGKLLDITHSRPDIAFLVGFLSRFMHSPTKLHQGAAKHLVRYLACTRNYRILYSMSKNFRLQRIFDSDWGSNPLDRKSTPGVVFNLGSRAINWVSKKLEIVALSSTKAEYIYH